VADIGLIAMSAVQQRYALLRLGVLGREANDEAQLPESLRSYLYQKYVYRMPDVVALKDNVSRTA
jgi:hypothetical protein